MVELRSDLVGSVGRSQRGAEVVHQHAGFPVGMAGHQGLERGGVRGAAEVGDVHRGTGGRRRPHRHPQHGRVGQVVQEAVGGDQVESPAHGWIEAGDGALHQGHAVGDGRASDSLAPELEHHRTGVDADQVGMGETSGEAHGDVGGTAAEVEHVEPGAVAQVGVSGREVVDDRFVGGGEVPFAVRQGLVRIFHEGRLGDPRVEHLAGVHHQPEAIGRAGTSPDRGRSVTSTDMEHDVVIVGAGLAGLAAARTAAAAGLEVVVLEGSDGVGGRVRTDVVDGYRLDRGFQILLTAYPELARWVDLDHLALAPFEPGALVRVDERFHRVGDPLRRPQDLTATLRAPVGPLGSKLRILALVASVRLTPGPRLARRPDRTTQARLEHFGFAPEMIERFFRPLFSGIQLDPDLEVSSRRFDLIWRMLAQGDAAVPAAGMGALPELIADGLADDRVRLGHPVERLDGTSAVLADGTRVGGRALVVATDGPTAARLTGLPDPGSRPVAAVWYGAPVAPRRGAVLMLDGDRSGVAPNVAVMSEAAPSYAPPGRSSIVAAVPGPDALDEGLVPAVGRQMRRWFGPQTDDWDVLRVDVIPHGQPDQRPPLDARRHVALGEGRYVCGDHRDTASIQGALVSGRRTGALVVRDLLGRGH